jgi:hypothetical protein
VVVHGGYGNGNAYYSDLWLSNESDLGSEWTEIQVDPTNAALAQRYAFGLVVRKSYIYIMGGVVVVHSGSPYYRNSVYRAHEDALEIWTSLVNAEWSSRSGFGLEVLPNGRFALFGGVDADGAADDIWLWSGNVGDEWEQIMSTSAPFGTRFYSVTSVISNAVCITAGYST